MKYIILFLIVTNLLTLNLAWSNRNIIVTMVNTMDSVGEGIKQTIEEIDNGRVEDE